MTVFQKKVHGDGISTKLTNAESSKFKPVTTENIEKLQTTLQTDSLER